ncbi:hypothetical protein K501DRAFT_300043 [Backusella circina FSU 941]|nr:hypothetical protein K501DRAFT_300043 [Backusella circina FSU 941]
MSSKQVKDPITDEKNNADDKPTLLAAETSSKKWQNWWVRTITTLIMVGLFFAILASGYIISIILVMVITVLVYREVIKIAYYSAKDNLRWFKTMSWYYFLTASYFLYGESIIYYFKKIIMVDAFLLPFVTHHRFISFMLYIIGFVENIILRFQYEHCSQMSQFGWTHMAVFLIVVQAHFVVENILEGLVWFGFLVSIDIWDTSIFF